MSNPIPVGMTSGNPIHWDPDHDGPLLIEGACGAGKTWYRDHTLIPRLHEAGHHIRLWQGVKRGEHYGDTPMLAEPVGTVTRYDNAVLVLDDVSYDQPEARLAAALAANGQPIVIITQLWPDQWHGPRLRLLDQRDGAGLPRGRFAEWATPGHEHEWTLLP